MPSQTINRAGLDLIEQFEGLRLNAYRDSVGVWTIGYGHTRGVKPGDVINRAGAEQFLREDVRVAEVGVNRWAQTHGFSLTENQFSALVSFAFNLGADDLEGLASHGFAAIADRLLRYNHAGGKVVDGLTRRRKAERELFLKH